jgi:hypothetical protein
VNTTPTRTISIFDMDVEAFLFGQSAPNSEAFTVCQGKLCALACYWTPTADLLRMPRPGCAGVCAFTIWMKKQVSIKATASGRRARQCSPPAATGWSTGSIVSDSRCSRAIA